MMGWAKKQVGFTIIEVLVAIVVLVVGLLAIANNTISVTRGNRISATYTTAINLAQKKMEEIKAQSSFSNVTNIPDPNNPITATGASGGIFTRTWSISNSTESDLKQVDVTASWTEYGVTRTVRLSTYVYTG